jgi:hypothetical protein
MDTLLQPRRFGEPAQVLPYPKTLALDLL